MTFRDYLGNFGFIRLFKMIFFYFGDYFGFIFMSIQFNDKVLWLFLLNWKVYSVEGLFKFEIIFIMTFGSVRQLHCIVQVNRPPLLLLLQS